MPRSRLFLLLVTALGHIATALPAGIWSLGSSTLNVSVAIAASGHVSISAFQVFASGDWTINLASAGSAPEDAGGTTVLDSSKNMWFAFVNDASTISANETDIVATGLLHGPSENPFCTESWNLHLAPAVGPLAGMTWTWTVQRTWLSSASVLSDRTALLLQMTGAAPIHGYQIPSFVNPAMFMDTAASAGFPLYGSSGTHFYEFLVPSKQQVRRFKHVNRVSYLAMPAVQLITLTPVVAHLWSEASSSVDGGPFLSFAKPFADGTAVLATLGIQVSAVLLCRTHTEEASLPIYPDCGPSSPCPQRDTRHGRCRHVDAHTRGRRGNATRPTPCTFKHHTPAFALKPLYCYGPLSCRAQPVYGMDLWK